MAPTAYHGSCHCRAVTFTVLLDLDAHGTTRCNCTICAKTRSWMIRANPSEFTVTSGESELTRYAFGTHTFPHYFCKHCGVHTHFTGTIPGLGEQIVVQLQCLDGVDPKVLGEAPMRYMDNLNEKPREQPEYIKHL